jgi:hypothetical protein
MGESARYLYAVTRGLDPTELSGVHGLGELPVDVVEHRGLLALVSTVDLDEYGEEALRRNLEQLDWLESVARTHDEVIHAVAALGPTAPLRLATICLDDDGVRKRLDEWHFALEQVLDRVEGRREWSVKVVLPPPPAAPATEQPVSGAAYLKQRKEATRARDADGEAALKVAEDIHQSLGEHAAASRRLPAQDPRLSGHVGTMLLNGAYLVPVEGTTRFEEGVAALTVQHPDVTVDCRGPWPPYSFAMLEQG